MDSDVGLSGNDGDGHDAVGAAVEPFLRAVVRRVVLWGAVFGDTDAGVDAVDHPHLAVCVGGLEPLRVGVWGARAHSPSFSQSSSPSSVRANGPVRQDGGRTRPGPQCPNPAFLIPYACSSVTSLPRRLIAARSGSQTTTDSSPPPVYRSPVSRVRAGVRVSSMTSSEAGPQRTQAHRAASKTQRERILDRAGDAPQLSCRNNGKPGTHRPPGEPVTGHVIAARDGQNLPNSWPHAPTMTTGHR